MNLPQQLEHYRSQINQALNTHLPKPLSFPLFDAMHYCTFNGGKRFRPLLVYFTGQALGLNVEKLNPIACALEFIHTFSLVHDDLPAMDNANLRRGRPTCHKQYDEATAILVGDALSILAFEVIASSPSLTGDNKALLLQQLAQASGDKGMVKGQVLDLHATHHTLSIEALTELHQLKTGQLLKASVCMPASLATLTATDQQHLTEFAQQLGLAYQVQDDLLDIEGETSTLGKDAGIDKANHKQTFPCIVGIQLAKNLLQDLQTRALTNLSSLSFNTEDLQTFVHSIFKRDH